MNSVETYQLDQPHRAVINWNCKQNSYACEKSNPAPESL